MTIHELMEVFMDKDAQYIEIYNLAFGRGQVLFSGYYMYIPEEYDDFEVCSVDNLNGGNALKINVHEET